MSERLVDLLVERAELNLGGTEREKKLHVDLRLLEGFWKPLGSIIIERVNFSLEIRAHDELAPLSEKGNKN